MADKTEFTDADFAEFDAEIDEFEKILNGKDLVNNEAALNWLLEACDATVDDWFDNKNK